MEWLNPPANWQESGNTIKITADPKTDFWRKTRHGYVVDNGHFYYQTMTGNFTASVKVTAKYGALYDQAGMMLRLNDTTWVKCGVELVEGIQYAGVVVTRDFSDWSTLPLPDNPASMWFRLSRYEEAVEVDFSRDGKDYHMLRQAYFSEEAALQVGVMACAPTGEGFLATLEDFQVKAL